MAESAEASTAKDGDKEVAESNKDNKDSIEWLKGKGFTERDRTSLAEFGFGPAVTSSIVQSCLNNKQLLDSLTRGGRKLLNTLHSELNSADQGATVKQSPNEADEAGARNVNPEVGNEPKADHFRTVQMGEIVAQNNEVPIPNQPPQQPASQNIDNPPPRNDAGRRGNDQPPHAGEQQPDLNYGRQALQQEDVGGRDEADYQEEGGVQSTLEDLLARTGVTYNHLNRECSDEHLLRVARNFSNVRSLGGCLKLAEYEIVEILRQNDLQLLFQLNEVVRKWKEKFGHRATYLWLVEMCLEDFGNAKAAESICELSKECGPAREHRVPRRQEDDLKHLKNANTPTRSNCCSCACLCYVIVLAVVAALIAAFLPQLLTTPGSGRRPVDQAPAPPVIIRPPKPKATPPSEPKTTPPPPSRAPPPDKLPPHTGPLSGTIIKKSDRPKMPQLRSFKLRTGDTIDFVNKVGINYRKFGQLLLQDSNEVDILEASCHQKPKCIVDRLLGDWINGRGRLPVTWETLEYVLDEAELSILAHDVRGQYSSDRDEL